jgi:cell division protein FtsB
MAGKRNNSAAIGFGLLIKVVLLISLIGGGALGYVWQKSQIERLGIQQRDRENAIKKLRHDNEFLVRQIKDLQEPVKLMRRVGELQLGLVSRSESQVVRLEEPREAAPEANNFSRQLTRRSGGGLTP